jgi:hypothetical protein
MSSPNAGVSALFSPAQLTGYLAFVLGVLSFLQKDDRRLKATVGLQACTYAVHFTLLGVYAAAVASLVTLARAFISLRTRSPYVAIALLGVTLVLGLTFAESARGWLPILASSCGTVAFFFFEGIAMRGVLLLSTLLWLANNSLAGSVGGTLLELVIGVANGSTCYRILRDRARAETDA